MDYFKDIVIIGNIEFGYTLLEGSHKFGISEEIAHHIKVKIHNDTGFDHFPSLKVHTLSPYRFFFFQFPSSFILIKLHESDKLCRFLLKVGLDFVILHLFIQRY